MKHVLKITIYTLFLLLFVSCEKDEEDVADLAVNQIAFTETYKSTVLDLPYSSYMSDNPNFDINKSETWTGNMAEYVKNNYIYTISYNIKNKGSAMAYDTEIDLHYFYDNGEEKVETISLGEIIPNQSFSSSITLSCTNKQLIRCSAVAFWTY